MQETNMINMIKSFSLILILFVGLFSPVLYNSSFAQQSDDDFNLLKEPVIQLNNLESSLPISSQLLNKMEQKFDSKFYDKTIQMINAKSQGKLPEFLAESRSMKSISDMPNDKQDSYQVLVVVDKRDDAGRISEVVAQENKENLASILRDTHGATDIYVAEKLSFVSATIPVSEIPKLSEYENIVSRVGDGEQKVFPMTTIEQAQTIINSDDVFFGSSNFPFTGQGVTVSIIDSPGILDVDVFGGVTSHPDLPFGEDETVVDYVTCFDGNCSEDIARSVGANNNSHHSIRIASIIAGQGTTANLGIAPNAELLDVSFRLTNPPNLGDTSHSEIVVNNMANALDWSIRTGADLVSLSISPLNGCHQYDAFGIIIDEAVDEGMMVVSAVGNIETGRDDVSDVGCPYNTIAVGAVDENSVVWEFSMPGPAIYNEISPDPRIKPELVTPGVDIRTANAFDGYDTASGTSFATPFVTGAAALIKDIGAAPYYTPLETKVALLLGAKWDPQNDIPSLQYPFTAEKYEDLGNANPNDVSYQTLNKYGFGLLDVEQSLTYATTNTLTKNHIIRDTIAETDPLKLYTFTADSSDVNKQAKVILSWLSQPLDLGGTTGFTDVPVSNLNFEIVDPDNIQVALTRSDHQNNEFVVFTPIKTGTYTIFVDGDFVDDTFIQNERFVIGSTIQLDIPGSNQPPLVPVFDHEETIGQSQGEYVPKDIWLSATDANNDIISFYVVDEPDNGALSPPIKDTRNSARVIYQADPDFDGEDSFSFKAYDGKTISSGSPITVVINEENIVPNNEAEDGLLAPPATVDDTTTKPLDDEIKQVVTSFDPPTQSISEMYIFSTVPASLSFESSPTSFASLDANSGKLITFTDTSGINPTNIKIATQNSKESDSVTVGYALIDTPTNTEPDPPTNLAATAVSATQIDLSWAAPSDDGGSAITGYKIERETPTDGNGFAIIEPNATPTSTTFSDNMGLSSDTQYNYRVSAINTSGSSLSSNIANATTLTMDIMSAITIANPSPNAYDWFGYSVAGVGNDKVVVGTHRDDSNDLNGVGSALVFDASTGSLLTTLDNPTPGHNGWFGYSVAGVGNDKVVVGALYYDEPGGIHNVGIAYVFDASTGSLLTTLDNPDPDAFDFFGYSVTGIGNDKVAVGAHRDDPNNITDTGSAYVFDASTGSLLTTLDNPTPDSSDHFGYSVTGIGNDKVAVGAHRDDPNNITDTGSAYVFDASTGSLLTTLDNPTPDNGDYFGWPVTGIGNDKVAVGAHRDDPNGLLNAGSAYVFDASTGSLLTTLVHPDLAVFDWFGSSVADIGNDMVVVGAHGNDLNNFNYAGSAYVFDASTGSLLTTLDNPDPGAFDSFGRSVAGIGNDKVAVGAYNDSPNNLSAAGSAYVFELGYSATASATTTPSLQNNDVQINKPNQNMLSSPLISTQESTTAKNNEYVIILDDLFDAGIILQDVSPSNLNLHIEPLLFFESSNYGMISELKHQIETRNNNQDMLIPVLPNEKDNNQWYLRIIDDSTIQIAKEITSSTTAADSKNTKQRNYVYSDKISLSGDGTVWIDIEATFNADDVKKQQPKISLQINSVGIE